jgi:biotin carboxyl carrier protein
MTGQTIPCFDQLGVKPDFSPSQPGLFRDFDQITFYRVEKKELERDMALFRSGRYKFQYEDVIFDMGAHNRLLEQTRDEVAAFKSRQAAAQVEMLALENESMDRWMAEKAQNKLPADEISMLRQGELNHLQIRTWCLQANRNPSDPDILTLYAPLDANVWKVCFADGDIVSSTKVVAILEAMKMEIAISYNGDKKDGVDREFKIEKVLVQPGDTVKAGDALVFLRDI